MNEILFVVGDLPIRAMDALIGFGALALILLLTIAIVIARSGRRGAELAMAQAIRADELEERLSEMLRYQAKGFFGFRLDLRSKLSSGPDKSRPDIYPDHGSLPVNRNTLPALRSR